MRILEIDGAAIEGIMSCLPERSVDNLACCRELYGDEEKAEGVVKATGIAQRRIAAPGETSLDLCVRAAERLLAELGTDKSEIGAVISVSFTPARAMPGNAAQAQKRLGLGNDLMAFDLGLACSGWVYGLYLAGLLVRETGRKVLLLDGDVQTAHVDERDVATVPVLADAGTAALVGASADSKKWSFAFLSKGEDGEALKLPAGGKIAMDGFGVFKFVATDVVKFVKEFLSVKGMSPSDFDAFVPHQANVYMIRQLARSLGFDEGKLWVSGDKFGNSASATVPVTIAHVAKDLESDDRRLLVAGFGGGLSAGVASVQIGEKCQFGEIG